MKITGRHSVAQEGQTVGNGYLITPGSLRWKSNEAVGAYLHADYSRPPVGLALNFMREGKDIMAQIDWNEHAVAQGLVDETFSFRKDWYDLFVYVTEVKYTHGRKGNYILTSGLIRAIAVIPVPAFPRGVFDGVSPQGR